MEKIIITTLQIEDLQNLIKESIRQVLNENDEKMNQPEVDGLVDKISEISILFREMHVN